ncbi:MAG: hypothetical protein ACJAVV_000947 [Alphaproteobacteria bacterium]|jgi:hypothetical protein
MALAQSNHSITIFTSDKTKAITATAKHMIDDISSTIESNNHIDSKVVKLVDLILCKWQCVMVFPLYSLLST